jgi:hypothetical protein
MKLTQCDAPSDKANYYDHDDNKVNIIDEYTNSFSCLLHMGHLGLLEAPNASLFVQIIL